MSLIDSAVAVTGSLATGASASITPSAGQEWAITAIGSGAGNPETYTDLYLSNGTTDVKIRQAGSFADDMWRRMLRVLVTSSIWMKFKNTSAGTYTYYAGGIVTRIAASAASVGDVKNGIVTGVASGAYTNIQPPVGESWGLFEVGSSVWAAATYGAEPHIQIEITDGVNQSVVAAFGSIAKRFRVPLMNSVYLKVKNLAGSAADIAYSAQRVR